MKVFISGYYGFGNLGDEMLLDALKNLLLETGFRRDDIVVLSASPENTLREHMLPAIKRGNFISLLLNIKKGDILISGPGGLFQDVTGPWSPLFYASHIFLALIKGAKIFLYGQSFGPIKRKFNLKLLKFLSSMASLVVLRDKSMSDIVPEGKLFFTPDPAFALCYDQERGKERNGICLVFRRWSWDLDALVSSLIKTGLPLTLVSFQPSLEREEGLDLSRKYELPFYGFEDWKEALNFFSQFKILVGMRLHSLIISAMAFTPFIGISYDPKIKNLCDLLEMPYIEDEKGFSLLDRYVDALMVKWDREKEKLKKKVELLRSEVKAIFVESMDILMGRERC
ncbi:MAG: polysaccharide pyruvyl transferase family protein [Synergistetes bacterium]|nr:polysaccharide pyruvyl transferase family protein [Synergistota bacterium]MCX8127363.1 polysaccharide pyruvyl transferase family protein [Synergistota bacterium]MDW8192227.1 polysaccharide pyruvyl transferase family protein [Synergistota bacterium]